MAIWQEIPLREAFLQTRTLATEVPKKSSNPSHATGALGRWTALLSSLLNSVLDIDFTVMPECVGREGVNETRGKLAANLRESIDLRMKKRSKSSVQRIGKILTSLLVIGSGFAWVFHHFTSGPDYGGQPWSYWIAQVEPDTPPPSSFPGFHLSETGIASVRKVGTSELPTLMSLLAEPRSGLQARIHRWSTDDRLPNLVRRWLIPFYPQSYNPSMAVLFFRALGSEANEAIPELVEMLRKTNDARWAAIALVGIGPKGVAALEKEFPLIRDGLVRANVMAQLHREHGLDRFCADRLVQDPHPTVRMSAARNLGTSANRSELAIPALTKSLDDQEAGVRFEACKSLGQFGAASVSAVDRLEAMSNDSNAEVRFNTAQALGTIRAAVSWHAEE